MAGRLGHVGLAVALAGLLVACGSSGVAPSTSPGGGGGGGAANSTPGTTGTQGGGGGGGSGDTCSLITAAQVSAALGQTVGPGDSGGDPHECDFAHLNSDGLPDAQVIVNSNEDTSLCDEGSSSALGITVTQLSGIGDKACLTAMTGLVTDLTFYKGGGRGWSVAASGKNVTAANVGSIEQQLAQDILGHL
jgi:hypothetical protein